MTVFLELFNKLLLAIIALAILAFVSGDMSLVTEGVPTILRFAVAGMCLVMAVLLMKNMWYVVKNCDVYERNRQATMLLKKYRRGSLTERERERFRMYRDSGVITYNGHGHLRLSDNAVRELFQ